MDIPSLIRLNNYTFRWAGAGWYAPAQLPSDYLAGDNPQIVYNRAIAGVGVFIENPYTFTWAQAQRKQHGNRV